jgi:hypothetical protein
MQGVALIWRGQPPQLQILNLVSQGPLHLIILFNLMINLKKMKKELQCQKMAQTTLIKTKCTRLWADKSWTTLGRDIIAACLHMDKLEVESRTP